MAYLQSPHRPRMHFAGYTIPSPMDRLWHTFKDALDGRADLNDMKGWTTTLDFGNVPPSAGWSDDTLKGPEMKSELFVDGLNG
ncbi:Uu.00g091260.m01.CDS01 [Anthostomella pinea]|uniref:Uu.00g091260.m01.CDS01 n=1 Tax=Anthostomella pinea TaxID=933095 RepID=A0AAI8VN22_9PEZI|nr:Uu.00g091260.m01.CDS01 [Anthostomella pinea]